MTDSGHLFTGPRQRAAQMLLALTLIAEMLLQAPLPEPTAVTQQREPAPRTIVVEVQDRGFHWADAGIGALALTGLGLAAAGATVAIRRPDGSHDRAEQHRLTNDERP